MSRSRLAQLEAGYEVDGVYQIQGRIGAGGMATVYRATQRDTGEDVALKLIDLGDGDVADTRKRFFNELLLATRVRHPNIVAVYDFGLLASVGTPYIVMELLEGVNLRQHIQRFGPLMLDEALPLFLGALGALGEAHTHGVVHKDLKPSNLFMCRHPAQVDPSLVIVDFGIAVRVSGGSSDAREYLGTPRYSPPEYILDRVVSPGLDVYQMGLVFCEAVSGEPVVASKGARECFNAHVKGQLDIPTDLLGPRLTRVIEKALAVDPGMRFPNAGEMLDALAEAVGDRGVPTLRQVGEDVLLSPLNPALRKERDPQIASAPPEDDAPDDGLPTGILDWDDPDFSVSPPPSEDEATEEARRDPTPPPAAPSDDEPTAPAVRSGPPQVLESDGAPTGANGVSVTSLVATGVVVGVVCCVSGALISWLLVG